MNLDNYKQRLLKLQNSLHSTVSINNAVIDIIEINLLDTGDATICPAHIHTWYEFHYVVSNSFHTKFDEVMFEVAPCHFFLVPPYTVHSHQYNNKSPHTAITIRWNLTQNQTSVSGESDTFKILNHLKDLSLICYEDKYSLLDMLLQLFEDAEKRHSAIDLRLSLVKFLIYLSEIVTYDIDNLELRNSNAVNIIAKKVELYLNAFAFKGLDVHAMADSLHMSYRNLARIYKRATRHTILDRFCSIKLEKSLYYLENTDFSIKEIVEMICFTNQYYFSNAFKNKYGVSPKEYRKLNRKTD